MKQTLKKIAQACQVVGSQSQMARALGVAAPTVNQWVRGIRPIPIEYCTAIEIATSGAVTRRDLRPNDWHLIWPELAESQASTATKEAVV